MTARDAGGANMVQRYRPDSDEQERSFEMIPDDGGDYVAHGDYEELEAEVAKLTAERDADRRREYGYSQQTVDALTVERDKLKAENKRLRKLLHRCLMGGVFFSSFLVDEVKALGEASHEG